MKIGETTVTDAPTDPGKFSVWWDEFIAAGSSLLEDDRTRGFCFDGRPLTNMEMYAAIHAARESWDVMANRWIESFEHFLETQDVN